MTDGSPNGIEVYQEIETIRTELETRVDKQRKCFVRQKRLYRLLYYGFLALSAVSGFSASLNAALADEPWSKPALVILPLVATFSVSLIQQFNWCDLYELREQGRIDATELMYLVERSRPRTLEDLGAIEATTYHRLVEISRSQSASFFTYMRAEGKGAVSPNRQPT